MTVHGKLIKVKPFKSKMVLTIQVDKSTGHMIEHMYENVQKIADKRKLSMDEAAMNLFKDIFSTSSLSVE